MFKHTIERLATVLKRLKQAGLELEAWQMPPFQP